MLLSLFFSSSATLFCLFSFFFLISSSHTHTLVASLGWLVGSFGWLFPSLPPHPHTLSLLFLGVCAPPPPACTGVLSAHTHTYRQGWLAGERTGTQSTHHHHGDGMRCHTWHCHALACTWMHTTTSPSTPHTTAWQGGMAGAHAGRGEMHPVFPSCSPYPFSRSPLSLSLPLFPFWVNIHHSTPLFSPFPSSPSFLLLV